MWERKSTPRQDLINSNYLDLVAPVGRTAQFILYRTTDASLCGELLADGAVFVERPTNFLCCSSDGSVL